MFLDPEELALVLLEQTRVVVDFALEDLVGRLVEDGRAWRRRLHGRRGGKEW